jgi:hypothetical protein
MIAIKLQGGIGNALFQIATIETLGKNLSQAVCYSNVDAWIDSLLNDVEWIKHAEDYLDMLPNLDFYKNHYQRFKVEKQIDVGFRYTPITMNDGNTLNGYFQSEKNFPDKTFIRWLFTPSEIVKEKLSKYKTLLKGNTCSIHVRRGNYRNLQNRHPVLSMDYYTKAMSMLEPYKIDRFLIFSNDINWCKYNFMGDKFTFIDDVDYVELFLMASCTHHIISNSTFAWWGAWLGEKQDTAIIAPEVWFGNLFPEGYAEDIVPERWVKV